MGVVQPEDSHLKTIRTVIELTFHESPFEFTIFYNPTGDFEFK
jgi:hypothetical protein